MSVIGRLSVLVTLAIVCGAPMSWSQDGRDELKRTVERRFDVLPLREGVALRPKAPIAGIRSIEISGGMIGIDGQPATGAELRSKLGADADALLQLSYMSDAARQSLFAATPAGAVPSVSTPPVPPAPPAPQIVPPTPPDSSDIRDRPRRSRGERRNGDRVRIGGDVTVEEGEVVDGDVVAVGGKVRVDGEVRGDVVAVGGGVTLGPRAIVEDNVTAVGGSLQRDPGAQVNGKAQEIDLGGFKFDRWTWRSNPVGAWWSSMLGSAFAFVGTLVRVAVLCLFVALVVLFGREYMDRAASIATTEPVKAGAIGFAAQVLFIPLLVITIVVLAVTIVGIPLIFLALPFALIGLVVAGLVGFSGVANRLGAFALDRLGRHEPNPYVVTVVGVLVVMAPVVLSRVAGLGGGLMFPFAMILGIVGAVVEYVAWTVGFGAIALMRFRRRSDGRTGVAGPTDDMATSSPSA